MSLCFLELLFLNSMSDKFRRFCFRTWFLESNSHNSAAVAFGGGGPARRRSEGAHELPSAAALFANMEQIWKLPFSSTKSLLSFWLLIRGLICLFLSCSELRLWFFLRFWKLEIFFKEERDSEEESALIWLQGWLIKKKINIILKMRRYRKFVKSFF